MKKKNKIRVCRLLDSRYDEKTTNNDIALLKLKKKIDFKKFSGTVLPVCLPDLPRKYYGETVTHKTKIVAFFSSKFLHQVTVSGWGLLSDGGKAARKLQEVDLEVPIAHQCHCLLHNAHCPRSITHFSCRKPIHHLPVLCHGQFQIIWMKECREDFHYKKTWISSKMMCTFKLVNFAWNSSF